ncbi:hypothetical protein LIA77_02426 [Sarocladium implicatum]|nr:hypothetical protein LIA77_02426 [Sarocladium implicatum]
MASDNNGNDSATAAEQESYKNQLDRVATERRNQEHQPQVHPVVEKIVEYVPPVAPLLGVKQDKPEDKEGQSPPGPPERPNHDVSIEEFVRDQHRSNGEEGLLAGKK